MSRVLIVDDAVFMRFILREILNKNGFEVVGEACTGAEGIIKARELKPDLITMDITMPDVDGIKATSKITEENPNAIICMVSAMGQESRVIEAIQAGAKEFIVKPFKEEDVVKKLRNLLG